MPRLSKSSVYAALDRAANIILQAGGGDAFISRRDIRQTLMEMKGPERALVQHFYRFIDARDAGKGARVTPEDVNDAVAYTREKILDRYDLNHNGFSQTEIAEMSELGKLAVSLAIHLKRAAVDVEINTSQDLARKLKELIEGMYFTGFGSEGEDELKVVHLHTVTEHLDAETLARALHFDTSTPDHAIARFYPYSADLNYELIDTIYYEGDNFGVRAGEVTRLMTRYLRDLIVVIFGEDGNSAPQHPVYWAGVAEDGTIVGLKSVVIWT